MTEAWSNGAVSPPRRFATVFLSFAGDDRATALRLRDELRTAGIEARADAESFPPGINLPLAISEALSQSDYYLLFWSRHAVNRAWVNAEWSAAFAEDLRKRGTFLFIAKLDATPLPSLLAPRRYLDARGDWGAFVSELIGIWKRDRLLPEPVRPAPAVPSGDGRRPDRGATPVLADPSTRPDDGKPWTAEIYVRNRALAVSHLIVAPSLVTGADLWSLVRESLQLKESVSKFMGTATLSFRYELSRQGQQIPDDKSVQPPFVDGVVVDLVVHVEVRAQHETVTTMQLRGPISQDTVLGALTGGGDRDPERNPGRGQSAPDGKGAGIAGMDRSLIRTLLDDAFGHLSSG